MTDKQIKTMFSKEVLKFKDKSAEMCLRRILFEEKNTINWQDAYKVALDEMPELVNYKC
jgi:hypothetical protein